MRRAELRTAAFISGLACLGLIAKAQAQNEPGWNLVWQDEFNGPTIDSSKWTFQTGPSEVNAELEYYSNSSQNAFIQDSTLVIRALQQSAGGRNYTSAKLYTQFKGDWLYGRVEVKAKLNHGQGMWPAIWMMPTDNAYGTWPASGEMDIMELLGQQTDKVYGTIHYAVNGQHQQQGSSLTLSSGNFADTYHIFAYEWDADQQRWYVDDSLYFSTTLESPFDQRFYLILNVAVGGSWPGSPDSTTPFPNDMTVDYVRIYQKPASSLAPAPTSPPFRLAANPFQIQTRIAAGSAAGALTLRDLSGRVREQRRLSARAQTDLGGNLSAGIYFLQWVSGGQTQVTRLIKER